MKGIGYIIPKKRRFANTSVNNDKDYGRKANKPDMDDATYNIQKEIVLNTLKDNQQHRLQIAEGTVNQYKCNNWLLTRKKIITSSKYGPICRLQDKTERSGTVSDMLYKNVTKPNADMIYGLQHEKDALKELEKCVGHKVYPTRLWIDPVYEFLGASPDGLIDTNLEDLKICDSLGIEKMKRPLLIYKVEKGCCVEIKCPSRGKNRFINDLLAECQNLRRIYNSKQPNLINKNHYFYYQLQGQMHHTERKDGLLVLWTDKEMKITPVFRDDNFWRTKMEPKLKSFYFDCLLPEIVDSRSPRGMKLREPLCVTEGQKDFKKSSNISENTEQDAISNFVNKSVAKKRQLAKRKIKIEMDMKCQSEKETGNKKAKIDEEREIIISKENEMDIKCQSENRTVYKKAKIDDETEIIISNENKEAIFVFDSSNVKKDDDVDDDVIFVLDSNNIQNDVDKERATLLAQPQKDLTKIAVCVLTVTSWLTDHEIDTFLSLVGEQFPNFEMLSVLNMNLPEFVKECQNDDVQIIGGSVTGHWVTCHYEKQSNKLFIYDSDSLRPYKKFSVLEKKYLSNRYPNIKENDVITVMLTKQPDGSSCGVYSCAALLSVVLGINMKQEYFSKNALLMRQHFMDILYSRELKRFPQI